MSDGEFTGFPAEALRFLRALRRNNEREWFNAQRARYEQSVRMPLAALIEEMDARFARFAPEITGDPKRSAFRIHRDIRFSADKSPYKTHSAVWFYHRDAGKGVGGSTPHGGAGFYFHLEPNASMVAGGLWMPPPESLRRIRQVLEDGHQEFARLIRSRGLAGRFGSLNTEAMLRRVPRGVDPEHPGAEWMRHRSFTMSRPLSNEEVQDPRLAATLERDYRALLPLVRWLNSAVGFPPAKRR
jgi:uncharacterized protein (TIGR02453 family)